MAAHGRGGDAPPPPPSGSPVPIGPCTPLKPLPVATVPAWGPPSTAGPRPALAPIPALGRGGFAASGTPPVSVAAADCWPPLGASPNASLPNASQQGLDGQHTAARSPAPDGAPAAGPLAGGAPSFAQVLLHSFRPPVTPISVHPPACTDGGEPAAYFTLEEISLSCQPLQTAIIAKTPQGRPPFPEIRAHLMQRFKLQQDFVLSAMDNRHLLIRFQNCDDYLQVLLKEAMQIQGRPFRFSRWSMDFCPETDSPVVPVWMELPQLPANFFTESMVRSIAGSIGPVLKVDRNTLNMARTQAARANVQLDVSKDLPKRIWVGCGSKGFWQPIVYPDPPLYCCSCRRLGHPPSKCKKSAINQNQGPNGPGPEQQPPAAKHGVNVHVIGVGQAERQIWRPVLTKGDASVTSGTQCVQTSVEGEAPNDAHQLFDVMPDQQSSVDMEMKSVPVDHGNVPRAAPSHTTLDQGTTTSVGAQNRKPTTVAAALSTAHHLLDVVPTQISAMTAIAKRPTAEPVKAPAAMDLQSAPLTATQRNNDDHLPVHEAEQHHDQQHDQVSMACISGLQPEIQICSEPVKSVETAAHPLDSMRPTCEGARSVIAAPSSDEQSATSPRTQSRSPIHEAPQPVTPTYVAPSATTQLPAAPYAPKYKGQMLDNLNQQLSSATKSDEDENTPRMQRLHTLNANAPAYSPSPSSSQQEHGEDGLLEDPVQFARLLQPITTEDTTPSTEAKRPALPAEPPESTTTPSPTNPSVSFADALRKKATRGNINRRRYKPMPSEWLLPGDPNIPRPGPSPRTE